MEFSRKVWNSNEKKFLKKEEEEKEEEKEEEEEENNENLTGIQSQTDQWKRNWT